MVDNERFLSSFGALPVERWPAALLRSTEERIVGGVTQGTSGARKNRLRSGLAEPGTMALLGLER